MSEAKLKIERLSKRFGEGEAAVQALDGANFSVGANEFVTLVGTSGCGKSTLLSIVAGLEEPTDGAVLVDNREVEGPGRDRGVVFQSYTLFPWLTARQNVEFALREEGLSKSEQRDRADRHLQMVGLDDFSDARPNQLSGGMRQRVAIARALSYRPLILLMDEPFGALDALTRQLMQELLTRIWEQHRLTVLFVTHDVEEAIYISDRVLVMTNRPGRIKAEIEVELPRPRSPEMLSDPALLEPKARLLEAIREESLEALR